MEVWRLDVALPVSALSPPLEKPRGAAMIWHPCLLYGGIREERAIVGTGGRAAVSAAPRTCCLAWPLFVYRRRLEAAAMPIVQRNAVSGVKWLLILERTPSPDGLKLNVNVSDAGSMRVGK